MRKPTIIPHHSALAKGRILSALDRRLRGAAGAPENGVDMGDLATPPKE